MEDDDDTETKDEVAAAYRVRLAKGGRAPISAKVRARLGFAHGDALIGELAGNAIVCKRWYGTVDELKCTDLACETTPTFEIAPAGQRDMLVRMPADDHGLLVSVARSQA